MIKKTRLSFSSISIEPARNATQREAGKDKKPTHNPTQGDFGTENRLHTKPAHRPADKKRTSKSSTYQYAKKGHGQGRGSNSYGNQAKAPVADKIPVIEKGVIRIIPLGGVEEVGRNKGENSCRGHSPWTFGPYWRHTIYYGTYRQPADLRAIPNYPNDKKKARGVHGQ